MARENVPGIPGACTARNFTYLARANGVLKVGDDDRTDDHTSLPAYTSHVCAMQFGQCVEWELGRSWHNFWNSWSGHHIWTYLALWLQILAHLCFTNSTLHYDMGNLCEIITRNTKKIHDISPTVLNDVLLRKTYLKYKIPKAKQFVI